MPFYQRGEYLVFKQILNVAVINVIEDHTRIDYALYKRIERVMIKGPGVRLSLLKLPSRIRRHGEAHEMLECA